MRVQRSQSRLKTLMIQKILSAIITRVIYVSIRSGKKKKKCKGIHVNARKNTRINIQNKISVVTIKLVLQYTYPYRSAKKEKEKGRKKANFLSYVGKKKTRICINVTQSSLLLSILERCPVSISFNSETGPIPNRQELLDASPHFVRKP